MQARNMLTAVALGINCSTGMSSMVRKEIVEKAGGLEHFGQYLAEDFFLAHETTNQYVYSHNFSTQLHNQSFRDVNRNHLVRLFVHISCK